MTDVVLECVLICVLFLAGFASGVLIVVSVLAHRKRDGPDARPDNEDRTSR